MGNSMELNSYKDEGVSTAVHTVNGHNDNKSPSTTQVEVVSANERDAQALAKLGKKPVLKVCTARRQREESEVAKKLS